MTLITGDRVVNKRNGQTGVIVATTFDGRITVQFDGTKHIKQIPKSVSTRWFRHADIITDKSIKHRRSVDMPPLPKGEKGEGFKARKRFDQMIRNNVPAGDTLTQKYLPNSHTFVYKLNGKNIFECTESSYRLSVMANPKFINPNALKYAYYIYPKERNWTLSARFIFTSTEQSPLMKAVILSGIYGRSNRK